MMSNKDLNERYKKVYDAVREILNHVDPELLRPGHSEGAPVGEYDPETAKIVGIIIHQPDMTNSSLSEEIDRIWIESFGESCSKSDELSKRIKIGIEKL